ncbi:unnamed protein product, partial [Musa banksii]
SPRSRVRSIVRWRRLVRRRGEIDRLSWDFEVPRRCIRWFRSHELIDSDLWISRLGAAKQSLLNPAPEKHPTGLAL